MSSIMRNSQSMWRLNCYVKVNSLSPVHTSITPVC